MLFDKNVFDMRRLVIELLKFFNVKLEAYVFRQECFNHNIINLTSALSHPRRCLQFIDGVKLNISKNKNKNKNWRLQLLYLSGIA